MPETLILLGFLLTALAGVALMAAANEPSPPTGTVHVLIKADIAPFMEAMAAASREYAAFAVTVEHAAREVRKANAMLTLRCVVPAGGLPRALEEVERRAELFAEIRRSTALGISEHRLHALESVIYDAQRGLIA